MTAELEEQLLHAEDHISKGESQLSYWKQFRDKGQHDNNTTIHLLEQELVDMEASFTEISSMSLSVYLWNELDLVIRFSIDDLTFLFYMFNFNYWKCSNFPLFISIFHFWFYSFYLFRCMYCSSIFIIF